MSTQAPDKKKTPLKWRLLTIAPPILLLAGILVLLYPVFATQYNNQRQERIASEFSAVAEQAGPDAVAESLRRADEYNLKASESPILDPWLDAQRPGTAQYQDYLSQLNLNDVMATIKIPSIDVNLPIYHGTDTATLDKGVGHLFGTALPVGGESTHTVLTGHTGLGNATMFDQLTSVKMGDYFYIETAGRHLKYQVTDIRVVLPHETESLNKVEGKDLATLITCTPYGVNTHRLLVTGERVPMDEAAVAEAVGRGEPRVAGVEDKPYRRRPAAPFTTSTLQQEASRKLRMNPRETMRVAQGLYENGFITYMRTDSTVLSGQAVAAARSQVAELYGTEYVPERPRVYASKAKGAQEAHEAIRPAGDHFRTPAQVSGELTGAQFRLYELIWKRTVASQMADAVGSTATVTVEVPLTPAAGESRDSGPTFSTAGLTASGTVITFRGFLAAYEEGRDAERYQDDSGASAKDAKDVRLPAMITGQELAALTAEASGHETTPPPRYTEASLVKALEEREIGRPSTYAATMSTISDRGYVDHRGQALVPTWLAFAVTRLLEENFTELVDYDFTASMERDLDRIAAGEEDRVAWLRRFYNGQGAPDAVAQEIAQAAASGELDAAAASAAELRAQGLKGLVDNLGEIDARAVNSIEIGEGITLRVGRYGPYLEDGEGKRANVPADVAPDELTVDKARELFTRAADDGRELGVDPVSGHVIIAKDGRYGPYVTEVLPDPEETAAAEASDLASAAAQAGETATKTAKSTKTKKAAKPKPRTASLLRSMDLSTVTLEQALDLLSLPRVVGQDPESGADITAQNGRYGPYLKKGTDSRSLETEEQIFTVTLEQALEIFAQPKRRRGQAAARGPLRELGQDPATGKPVVIKDGRFGPYFTDGEINVTLRRGDDPATVTPERAFELLAEKRAKGPTKKRATRKTAAKKTAAKKTATKKTAAKTATKTTTRKTAASKES